MKARLALLAILLSTRVALSASSGPVVDIATRAKGADKVVVATIVDVHASLDRNEYGDQLIISHTLLQVDETMKGSPLDTLVSLDVEGGTVGTLTLSVSDLPAVATGDRAVFFLQQVASKPGIYRPHLRGLGILKLDASDRVQQSSLTRSQIRGIVRAAQQ